MLRNAQTDMELIIAGKKAVIHAGKLPFIKGKTL
jgi:hypothetical protein